MLLPRIEIGKILVEVYRAIKNKNIVHIKYLDKIICIDGNSMHVYSPIRPNFLIANLFSYEKIDKSTWKFDTTVLYQQLVGIDIPSDPDLIYLESRYTTVEDRIRHYVDFVINL